MKDSIKHIIHNNTFILTNHKYVFWEEKKTIILSDLHLGKTGHFRKNGIAIPQNIYKEDMFRLMEAIQFFKPETLIIIGDLFHSKENKELDLFLKWRNDFSNLCIQLVKGNHDILSPGWYDHAKIEVVENNHYLIIDKFLFVHDINDLSDLEDKCDFFYTFSGHVHPSIVIKGMAKQAMRLPCFYFTKHCAILPAFGNFTGTFSIEQTQGSSIYAVIPANTNKGQKGGIIKI